MFYVEPYFAHSFLGQKISANSAAWYQHSSIYTHVIANLFRGKWVLDKDVDYKQVIKTKEHLMYARVTLSKSRWEYAFQFNVLEREWKREK